MDAFNKSRLHTEAKESRRLEKTASKIDERQEFGEQCYSYRPWLSSYIFVGSRLIIHRSITQHVSPAMMIQRRLINSEIMPFTMPVTRGHGPRNHSFNIELFLSVICLFFLKKHGASSAYIVSTIVFYSKLIKNTKIHQIVYFFEKKNAKIVIFSKKFLFFIEDLWKMTKNPWWKTGLSEKILKEKNMPYHPIVLSQFWRKLTFFQWEGGLKNNLRINIDFSFILTKAFLFVNYWNIKG